MMWGRAGVAACGGGLGGGCEGRCGEEGEEEGEKERGGEGEKEAAHGEWGVWDGEIFCGRNFGAERGGVKKGRSVCAERRIGLGLRGVFRGAKVVLDSSLRSE
jgi:hypothetical protein